MVYLIYTDIEDFRNVDLAPQGQTVAAAVIAVIDGGRIVAEGASSELKRRVGSSRLDLTLVNVRAFEIVAEALAHRAMRTDAGALLVSLPTDGSAAHVRSLLDDVAPDRCLVRQFAIHSATLDDVFLTLTGQISGRPAEELAHV